tara:strand:- start:11310 stop:12467 length:1158 start_codon:yes stop_codon:yes gene_type:complete
MTEPLVFFDHQVFDLQRVGGASRLFYEVSKRLANEFRSELGLKATRNLYLANHPGIELAEEATTECKVSRLRAMAFRLAGAAVPRRIVDTLPDSNRVYGLERLREERPDLLVPTYYDPYLLELKNRPPIVSTALDLIPERFPEFYVGETHHSAWKRKMMEGSDAIVAISNSTKNDLVTMWNIPPEKIHVVPLASSFVDADDLEEGSSPLPHPYLLFVGERGRYKNLYFMLESLRGFFHRNPDWQMLCVGAPFTKHELRFFEAIGLGDRVHGLSGDDSVVRNAYQHANCVAVPSQAEGFGLPVVEGLALGRRVVASRIPVFEEIAEDRIAYFDPKDPVELAEVVERECLRGSDSASEVLARREFAQKYSWEETTKGYSEVFRRMIS